jgi:hypothetical protein
MSSSSSLSSLNREKVEYLKACIEIIFFLYPSSFPHISYSSLFVSSSPSSLSACSSASLLLSFILYFLIFIPTLPYPLFFSPSSSFLLLLLSSIRQRYFTPVYAKSDVKGFYVKCMVRHRGSSNAIV